MNTEEIARVLEKHTEELMSLPGVVGTGLGAFEGTLCIKVFVAEIDEQAKEGIPRELEGHPVRVERTGGFSAGR